MTRNSVHRFIAYLMVLSILPLLALGLASFEISRSALEAEAKRHLAQLLQERKRYVELQIDQIESLIANVSGVEAITSGLALPYNPADNYSRLVMQARIGYILNGYVNLNGLVSIDIFSRRGANYHVGDTLDVSKVRRDVLSELERKAAASTRPVYWAGIVDNVNANSKHAQVITAAKMLYGSGQDAGEQVPLGVLLVNYSVPYLQEQVGSLGTKEAMQLALVDGNGRLVFHSDASRIGARFDAALLEQMGADAGTFPWTVDGSELLVSFVRIQPSGWPLVGFIPLSAIAAHAAAIGKATAVVGVLCLAIVVVAAAAYSRRVITPVRRITDGFKQLKANPGQPQERLPVRGEDDIAQLTGWFNAFLDSQREHEKTLAAQKQADEERRARVAAESANQAKSVFLASMSHELRTPLNAILGFAQILQMKRGLDEVQRSQVELIEKSGEHLLTLINDILDLAKVEAGKLELVSEPIALAPFLRDIFDVISMKAEQKGVAFVCEAAPELPLSVRGDVKRLRQVVMNLLDNAVKFTACGRVTLRVGADAPSTLRFAIEDTGPGIAAEDLERIFQPFEQVGERLRHPGGTGLGLAISRQLVRRMGGDIRVESRLGQGSCFSFEVSLPVVEAVAVAPRDQRVVAGYEGPRKRVLIVDDVAANRALMLSFLRPLGFELHEAGSGLEALARAEELHPDLVLMDSVMPVMDGLEATRRLRQTPGLETVPLIAVSAAAFREDQEKCFAAGATAFVAKPVDLRALLNQIGLLLKLEWVDAPAQQGTEPTRVTQ